MPRLSSCFLMCVCLGLVVSNPILVTVQSKSQEEMDALTEAIDDAAEAGTGPARTTLGVIEATMSRVVDVDDPYVTEHVVSVPTWGMLKDIVYDTDSNIWTFEYETMRIDSSSSLNTFNRVLYFTKSTTQYVTGDTSNACLTVGVDIGTCLTGLHTDYLMSQAPDLQNPNQDYISWHDTAFGVADPIKVTTSNIPNSLLQKIVIEIPHQRIRNDLGRQAVYTHPTEGAQVSWTFGIGMLFHGVGSNVVLFENFNLIENSFQQVAISRTNSYALARYVTFWTNRVQQDHSIRVAHIEYVLEPGYEVQGVNASINNQVVSMTDCSSMQAQISGLANGGTCVTQKELCVPDLYEAMPSCVGCVAYVIPLPVWASSPFKINTLITLKDTNTQAEVLTTLNFETSNMQDVCTEAVHSTFDAIDHVAAQLYRGYALTPQIVQGSFTVQNDTALGLPETLLTLILTPKDVEADNFFAEFPDQHINLDELYISHALISSLVEDIGDIQNTVQGTGDGRSTLQVDADLLSTCPMETSSSFEWDETAQCVTTQDWSLTGSQVRPKSSPTIPGNNPMYFVHAINLQEVQDATLTWLQTNIFAGSSAAASVFLQNTLSLFDAVPANRKANSKAYYIFPIYQWPDQSPIGLKDTSVVSFAWSVSQYVSSYGRRRLLQVPRIQPFQHPSNVKKYVKKHIPRISLNVKKKKNIPVQTS